MVVAKLNPIRLTCCLPATADCLARHLLQLEYDLSIRAVDKTYLRGFIRDMSPFWEQRDKKVPQQRFQAEKLGRNT
jgi:hypothetical protein